MNKDRIIELAREVGAGEPESLYGRTDYVVMTVGDLERFVTLVEREVRGDAEPVASVHIKDGCLIGSQRKSDADFPDGQYGLYPIGTHPTPTVVLESVDVSAYIKILTARLNDAQDEIQRLLCALKNASKEVGL